MQHVVSVRVVRGRRYGALYRGCRECPAGAVAPPPRQRGFHPGHGKAPRRAGTRGPQRASCSRPRLCSGLSAEGCWRGLNVRLPGGAAILPATSSSARSSAAATAVGASAGESAGPLSPPTAGPSHAGAAGAGESRRASRRGSITLAREACIVASVTLPNLVWLCWIEVRQMVLIGSFFF